MYNKVKTHKMIIRIHQLTESKQITIQQQKQITRILLLTKTSFSYHKIMTNNKTKRSLLMSIQKCLEHRAKTYLEDLVSFSIMVYKWSQNAVRMKKPRRSHPLHLITHL